MPQPTINSEQQRQHDYERCATEKRLCDEFVRVRDSGQASIDVIGEHHKAFNDAIQFRSSSSGNSHPSRNRTGFEQRFERTLCSSIRVT